MVKSVNIDTCILKFHFWISLSMCFYITGICYKGEGGCVPNDTYLVAVLDRDGGSAQNKF